MGTDGYHPILAPVLCAGKGPGQLHLPTQGTPSALAAHAASMLLQPNGLAKRSVGNGPQLQMQLQQRSKSEHILSTSPPYFPFSCITLTVRVLFPDYRDRPHGLTLKQTKILSMAEAE